MSYPTPMDVAESEDREAMTDPFADELAKCSVLYTENLVAEREALIAKLAECTEKRERYALQVCLLLDAMREAGVHIDKKWCWCDPLVESHADSADGATT